MSPLWMSDDADQSVKNYLYEIRRYLHRYSKVQRATRCMPHGVPNRAAWNVEKRHEMGFRQISVPALTTNSSTCECVYVCVCVHCGIFRTLHCQFNVIARTHSYLSDPTWFIWPVPADFSEIPCKRIDLIVRIVVQTSINCKCCTTHLSNYSQFIFFEKFYKDYQIKYE